MWHPTVRVHVNMTSEDTAQEPPDTERPLLVFRNACSKFRDLNRTRRDWHSDAHADRSRVVRPLQRSARSCCAENHDSRDSLCRASPHAGRITSCPVWIPVGLTSAAPVRCRADAERSGQRTFLFTL